MAHNLLPDELWLDIFDMAVEDTDFFEPTLPTAFSNASWFKTLYGDWALRTAQEEVNNAQRRSYATKKVRGALFDADPDPNRTRPGYHGHLQKLAETRIRVPLQVPLLQHAQEHATRLLPDGL